MIRDLSFEERKDIEKYMKIGLSSSEIAAKIGRHRNSINREFKRNGERKNYTAEKGQMISDENKKNGKLANKRINLGNRDSYPIDISIDISRELQESKSLSSSLNLQDKPDFPLITFNMWMNRYVTDESPLRKNWGKEKRYVSFWVEHLGNKIACNITPREIEECIPLMKSAKKNKPIGKETKRKYLLILSSIYTTAIKKWKWAVFNPLSCLDMSPLRKEQKESVGKSSGKLRLDFCEKVKKIMTQDKTGVRGIARKTGTSLSQIQRVIDPTKNISLETFLQITEKLGINITLDISSPPQTNNS